MTRAGVLVVAAVLTGALYVAGAVALGSPPDAAASGAEVVTWLRDHHDAARFYAWTATFGTLAFAVFAGLLYDLLPAPVRTVFVIGAAAFITETAVQAWFWGGLALHPGGMEPASARLVLDVATFWGPVLTGTTMAMIGAVTVLGLRGGQVIPAWLTVLGAVAFAEQAVETVTVVGTHGFTAPGGDMNVVLGAALTLLWFAGLAVWAVPRLRRAAAT